MGGGAHAILEAVCRGTPVVASNVSGNVGMLGSDYDGYDPWEMPMHWRHCFNTTVTNHVCSRNLRDSAAHARRGSNPAACAKRYAAS